MKLLIKKIRTFFTKIKNDYPRLEQKKIKYNTLLGIRTLDVIVVGCNRHVGLSLVDANTKMNRFCIHGKSSSEWDRCCRDYKVYEEKYDEIFDQCVKMIKSGTFKANVINVLLEGEGVLGGIGNRPPNCSFK
jgi:hypothetical protein